MSPAPLLTSAAEATGAAAINPWFIGVGVFLLLMGMLVGLLAFGGGREHS